VAAGARRSGGGRLHKEEIQRQSVRRFDGEIYGG
jgi:hypothetical protein